MRFFWVLALCAGVCAGQTNTVDGTGAGAGWAKEGTGAGSGYTAIGGWVSSSCGPPNYSCFTTSTANPPVITPYFSSSSPQNSTAYDTALNPNVGCIALATTLSTSYQGHSQTGSMSGGANGHDWSWDETMLAVSDEGGGISILGVTTNGSGCPQVTNPGIPAWHNILGPVAFDWFTSAGKTNHDIYVLKSKHIIQKATVSDLNTMGAFTTIFDYAAAGVCPGPIPSPIVSGTIFTPVSDGNGGLQFAQGLGTSGQGSATQVFVYSTTKGCTQLDLGNGVYYPWCNTGSCGSVAAIPLSTSGNYCYGFSSATDSIHDLQPTGDGTEVRISVISGGHAMTHGVCTGVAIQGTVAWAIGTGTTTYTNGELNGSARCPAGIFCQYDGHPSDGISKALGSGAGQGFNIRNVSNYAGAFTFAAPQLQSFTGTNVPQDNHGAWVPANTPDDFPMWLGATDLLLASDVSPCAPASEVYCPPYLGQVLFALPIDGSGNKPRLFVHTHSCGQPGNLYAQCSDGPDSYFNNYDAVTSASPQGNYMSFSSTDLHSFGLDSLGNFDSNILIVRLGNAGVIPATFFGLHWRITNPYPTVRFGSLRLWDSGTRWQQTQTSATTYSYTTLDSTLALAKTNGLKDVLLTLSATPKFISSDPTDSSCEYATNSSTYGSCGVPTDIAASCTNVNGLNNCDGKTDGTNQTWRNYIYNLATHIAGLSTSTYQPVTAFEMWNEFTAQQGSLFASWEGTDAQLVRLYQDANCIITGRGTGCNAGAMGVAAVGILPSALVATPDSVMQQSPENAEFGAYLNTAGALNSLDVVAAHTYTGSPSPTAPEVLPTQFADLNGYLASAGSSCAAIPCWSTEGSWGLSASLEPDLDMQAAFVARYYLLGWSSGFKRMYWYAWDGGTVGALWNPNGVNGCNDGGSGLGCITKAGIAYGQTYNWMVGSSLPSACTVSGTVWSCTLLRAGVSHLVLWDTAQSCSGGVCGTANQTVLPTWAVYQDMTSVSSPTTIVSNLVPVGAKPVILSQ